jgi:hypothetical protein
MHQLLTGASIALFLSIWQPYSRASVNMFIITPKGIVLGADGMGISGCSGTSQKHQTYQKIFLLRNHLAVSAVGLAKMESDTGTTLFDLTAFIRSLNNDEKKASIYELVRDIRHRGQSTILLAMDKKPFQCPAKDNLAFATGSLDLYIAGYDAGSPIVMVVKFVIDWKKHIVKHYVWQQPLLAAGNGYGMMLGYVNEFCTPLNPLYKKAKTEFSAEIDAFCAASQPREQDFSQFSLQRAANMVRRLIEVDIAVHPEGLGFPITIVTIPKTAKPKIKSFCESYPLHQSKLTKPFGCQSANFGSIIKR